eukprot:TRINITY_DN3748_c1_g1_i1.p1 TRINITY_DN3748_c1_g1~~TRINITY_DN3748_c1_g1_i1.p1  ORF type:complete len:1546 (+),score=251.70 TRINITY_DN3748_c1_g1_i1:527-5164(+)
MNSRQIWPIWLKHGIILFTLFYFTHAYDIEYPFEWVSDPSYVSAPPNSSIWNVPASCTTYTPSQDPFLRTSNAVGLRFFLYNEPCYMTPNFSNPNWVFPGPVRGVSIAPRMLAFANATAVTASYISIGACCFSRDNLGGIEYGIQNISYSNFLTGTEISRTCGCGTYTLCPGNAAVVSEGWVVNGRVASSLNNYTLDRSGSKTPNYCVLGTPSSWSLDGCADESCLPNLTIDSISGSSGLLRTRVRRNGDTIETFNISSSVAPLNSTKPTWLRFGGAKSVDYNSSGFFAWSLALSSVRVYLGGQCFDRNNISGDGCFNSQVEPFCRCETVGDIFRRSTCQCATSTTFTSLETNLTTPSFLSFDNETVITSPVGDVVNFPTAKGTWFILHSCLHGEHCGDGGIQRTLVLSVNGTWLSPTETQLTPCPADLCNATRSFIIDLAGLGAPFPPGTQLKFAWWSNPTLSAPPGLISQQGAVISSSPTLVLTRLEPRVAPTNATLFLAGATQTITFTSNIRKPSRISVWMYEGLTRGSPRPTNYSDSDSSMTLLTSSCNSAPFGSPISHQCVVQIPNARFPFNELFLVARVDFEGVNGTIGQIGVDVSGIYVAPLPQPVPMDTARFQLSFSGYSIDRQMTLALYVDNVPVLDAVEVTSKRNTSHCEFRLNPNNAAGGFLFPASGTLYVSVTDGTRAIRFQVGRVIPSPLVIFDSPAVEYFIENRTLTISGSGFEPSFVSSHIVYLAQDDSDSSVAVCKTTAVTSSQISCLLSMDGDSRLASGAVFASVSIFDGGVSAQKLIGYYQRVSVFTQYEPPLNLNLQTSSRLQFTLAAEGVQDPPNWGSLILAESILSSSLGLLSTELYSRFVYQDTSNLLNSTYNLEVYFTSKSSIDKFNAGSVPSNLTLIAQLEQSIAASTGDIYATKLTFASPTVDPSWPFLVYMMSPTQSNIQSISPSDSEISLIRSFAATLWDLAPSSLLSVLRPATSGSGYELTLYFKTSSAASLFNSYELPLNNSAIGDNINSIVLTASSGAFSCAYVRSSPFTRKNQVIDVSWPWIKFLLLPTSPNSTLPSAPRDAIADNVRLLFNISSLDLVAQFTESASSAKRAAASSGGYDATFFFATTNASSSFFSLGMPFNQTLREEINSIVASVSNGTFNSTYIGSNILAPIQDEAINPGGGVPWVAIFVPIGVVLLVVVILAAIFFRRRTLQMRRLEAQVEKLPDDLRSVLSIKSNDLIMGKKLGEGSFGAVYLGTYKGRKVAIKKLANNMISTHVADFFREASVMLSIPKNAFIVDMIGMCQELSNFSMVMELCPGGSLEDLLRRLTKSGQKLDDLDFFIIARGIALGMRHLAASGVVHRDLAARNVLLDAELSPKISDFGFSRVVGDNSKGKTQATTGPLRWMAPESLSKLEYSEKSDVWSFGAVLIEMLTAEVPFPEEDTVNVAVKVRDGISTALDCLPKDTQAPDWVTELIRMCFTFEETARPTFSEVVYFLDSHAPSGVDLSRDDQRPRKLRAQSLWRARGKSQKGKSEAPERLWDERYAEMEEIN